MVEKAQKELNCNISAEFEGYPNNIEKRELGNVRILYLILERACFVLTFWPIVAKYSPDCTYTTEPDVEDSSIKETKKKLKKKTNDETPRFI